MPSGKEGEVRARGVYSSVHDPSTNQSLTQHHGKLARYPRKHMSELIKIKIEDRVYTAQRFNPLEGMEYGAKILALVSPALGGIMEATKDGGDPAKVGAELGRSLKDPDLAPLLKKALGQCFTPENESLADEVTFNKWFMRHPGDMFSLGAQAAWQLVKDFFPSQLAGAASGLPTKLSGLKQKAV